MMPENVDTSGLIHKGVARTLTYPSGIVKATLFENKKKMFYSHKFSRLPLVFYSMLSFIFFFVS